MPNAGIVITAAVDQILDQRAPVIIPDTCSILDIIRCAFRNDVQGGIAASAQRLIERTERSPRDLWIVVPELVPTELAANKDPVAGELQTHIRRLEEQSSKLRSAAAPVLPLITFPHVAIVAHELHTGMAEIAQRFLDSSLVLLEEDQHKLRATARVVTREAPANQDQQYKDCVIVEQTLSLATELLTRGFDMPVIFVTSNRRDYGDAPTPRTPLDQQFASSNLTYVSNLSWAESLV